MSYLLVGIRDSTLPQTCSTATSVMKVERQKYLELASHWSLNTFFGWVPVPNPLYKQKVWLELQFGSKTDARANSASTLRETQNGRETLLWSLDLRDHIGEVSGWNPWEQRSSTLLERRPRFMKLMVFLEIGRSVLSYDRNPQGMWMRMNLIKQWKDCQWRWSILLKSRKQKCCMPIFAGHVQLRRVPTEKSRQTAWRLHQVDSFFNVHLWVFQKLLFIQWPIWRARLGTFFWVLPWQKVI